MKKEKNVDEKIPGIFQSEMALWVGILTTLVFFVVGKNWLVDLSNPLKYGFFFIWLFIVMLWLSFGLDHAIVYLHAPQALGGFLVLSPEGLGAAKAAIANKLQRTVNIALGSALATIGLTIPAVLAISLYTGRIIELGLEPVEIVLLILTLLVCTVNFVTERTNVLEGAVHLIIFISYLILIFD